MEDSVIQNFIEHYKALVDRSPHLAVHNFRCDNADYGDQLDSCRNCYLCFDGKGVEDCYYTYDSRWNKDSADLSYSNKCELCYDCLDCEECYSCDFCQDCENTSSSSYCYDCLGCQDCFGCVGLRRKQYHLFNEPYEKNAYLKKRASLKSWTDEQIRKKVESLRLEIPHVARRMRRAENCFGDYVYDSKNCYYVFKCHNLQDSLYQYDTSEMNDCMDVSIVHESELLYEAIENLNLYNCNFMFWCADCRDCEYMMYCFDCQDCFGCFNLKRKQYHILNEPYEKDEYFRLVGEIKKVLRNESQYMNFLPDVVQ